MVVGGKLTLGSSNANWVDIPSGTGQQTAGKGRFMGWWLASNNNVCMACAPKPSRRGGCSILQSKHSHPRSRPSNSKNPLR